MWILLAVVLKASPISNYIPIIENPLVYDTKNKCEENILAIYDKYKLLQANYPIEIEYKTNKNKQNYLMYSYIPDYNKDKIITYYYCLQTNAK